MPELTFGTMEEFLDFLPEDEARIVERLRRLVRDCIPEVEEYMSVNIPCYKRKRLICFIWAGRLGWGNKTFPGVRFGFQYGHLLTDATGYLERGNRKQVHWRDFGRMEEIDVEALRALLYEALLVDQAPRK